MSEDDKFKGILMIQRYDFHKAMKSVHDILETLSALPKQSPSRAYRLKAFLVLFISGWNTATNTIYSCVNYKDIKAITFPVCLVMVFFHAFIKHLLLYASSTKYDRLMACLASPLFTDHGRWNTCIDKNMRLVNISRLLFVYVAFGIVMLVIILTAFGFKDRVVPMPLPIDVKEQSIAVYVAIWIVQFLGGLIIVWMISSFDCIVMYFMTIASVQIKILRSNIMASTDDMPGSNSGCSVEFDRIVKKRLKKCVIHHIAIESYIRSIEDVFGLLLSIQVIVSQFIGIFVLFNLIITPATDPNFTKCILFFVIYVFDLALYCFPGNEIIEESNQIMDACYMADWVKCGPSVRKMLLIMMARSKRPLQLIAAKFVVLSIRSFMVIIKSSFSYFTVLKNITS